MRNRISLVLLLISATIGMIFNMPVAVEFNTFILLALIARWMGVFDDDK